MKRIIKVIFLISLFLSLPLYGQWEILNEGIERVNEIDFVNDNIGWLARRNVLLKTVDGGETWNYLPVAENVSLEKIDFINDTLGWAVTHHHILKSLDGGFSWIFQKEREGNLDELRVVDDSIVYVTEHNLIDTDGCPYPKPHLDKSYRINCRKS